MSLPTLFDQARKIHLQSFHSTLDNVHLLNTFINIHMLCLIFIFLQETLRKACEGLKHCEEMIYKLGLFSTNETKEEITTTNLKYILVRNTISQCTLFFFTCLLLLLCAPLFFFQYHFCLHNLIVLWKLPDMTLYKMETSRYDFVHLTKIKNHNHFFPNTSSYLNQFFLPHRIIRSII